MCGLELGIEMSCFIVSYRVISLTLQDFGIQGGFSSSRCVRRTSALRLKRAIVTSCRSVFELDMRDYSRSQVLNTLDTDFPF